MTLKDHGRPVTLARPKLRDTDETFASRLLGKHVTRTFGCSQQIRRDLLELRTGERSQPEPAADDQPDAVTPAA